jgi:hypothetical protein
MCLRDEVGKILCKPVSFDVYDVLYSPIEDLVYGFMDADCPFWLEK